MPDLHFSVLPAAQLQVWNHLAGHAAAIRGFDYYLAGGTALALQLGHRLSIDFDFFSRRAGIAHDTASLFQETPSFVVRERESSTLHAAIGDVKLSFIGSYRYPLLGEPLLVDGLHLAHVRDIAVMKLLAITHRAVSRDYIDLAAILHRGYSLRVLLRDCRRKYGDTFNVMLALRALASFHDLTDEFPMMLNRHVGVHWQTILHDAVQVAARDRMDDNT